MSELKQSSNLLWIDLEMTGLDPHKDHILEIASIVTDAHLNIIAEGPDLVIHQSPKVLKNIDPWSQKQHDKSGLLTEVQKSKMPLKEAEKITLDFVKQYCVSGDTTLCGNAIHHDRRFIIQYMPTLNEFLHYRLVDVSSIKVLVNRWYPPDQNKPQKGNAHRALADIRESIDELRYYREHYFRPVEP